VQVCKADLTKIASRDTEKVSGSVSKLFVALNRLPLASHEDDPIDNRAVLQATFPLQLSVSHVLQTSVK
jgi:hypothetical protein